jgi:solute carrier family 25 carnitine/acylcarnitine transporter 20/29
VSALEIIKQLYAEGGIGAFFDGLTPKMLRAALNHSVTFFIYDLVLKALSEP